MTSHASLGGSNAKRWIECPGSVALCETVPKPPPGEAALIGSAAHALAEILLKTDGNTTDPDLLKTLRHHPALKDFSDKVYWALADGLYAVQVYLDFVRGLHADVGMIEKRVVPIEKFGNLAFGTADHLAWLEDYETLVVTDYKHGEGVLVEIEDNWQFLFYAIGAYRLFPDAKYVEMAVVQPRARDSDEPIRRKLIPIEVLKAKAQELERAIDRATEPDPPFKAGEWCRWCHAKVVCPVWTANHLPEDFDPDDFDTPEPKTMTPAEIAKHLKNRDAIEAWFAALEAHATTLLMHGQAVPGFKLVAKQARAAYAPGVEADFIAWATGERAIPLDIVAPRKPITLSEAKKLLKGDKAAEGEFTLRFTRKESSGVKLVPESDRGEAVSPLDMKQLVEGLEALTADME